MTSRPLVPEKVTGYSPTSCAGPTKSVSSTTNIAARPTRRRLSSAAIGGVIERRSGGDWPGGYTSEARAKMNPRAAETIGLPM